MSRRDRNQDAPMSFFSFQDIIACITGIMVLVTLLLALELTMRTPDSPDAPRPKADPALQAKLNELKAKRDRLKNDLTEGAGILDRATRGEPITEEQVAAIRKAVAALTANIETTGSQIPQAENERDQTKRDIAGLNKEVDDLQKWLEQARENIEKRKKQPKVTLLRGEGQSLKPLFVEFSAGEIIVAEIPEEGLNAGLATELAKWAGADAFGKFLGWAKGRDSRNECFVLLVRVDAIAKWKPAADTLKGWGFQTGWDAWPADKSLFKQ